MRNVSRASTYETDLAAGVELAPEIPVNEYYEYFGPDYESDVRSSNTEDMNTPEYLERVKNLVLDNLRHLGGPPRIQMSYVPKMPIDEAMDDSRQDKDLIPPDARRHKRRFDSRIQADGELFDSDDEGEGGRRDHAHHRDRDSEPRSHSGGVESAAGRRFGIGVGILSSGAAGSIHGAGPSGHTNVVRSIPSGHLIEASTPTITESGPTPIEPSDVMGTTGHLSGDKSPNTKSMVVDDDNGTSAES